VTTPLLKIAENPLKTRIFTITPEIPGISPEESQRKKADFMRFLRQFAQARVVQHARFPWKSPNFSQAP
jgi:hypothetical protein